MTKREALRRLDSIPVQLEVAYRLTTPALGLMLRQLAVVAEEVRLQPVVDLVGPLTTFTAALKAAVKENR